MKYSEIIQKLPYTKPFLFVDEIIAISEESIEGTYTFKKEEFFYEGHFKNNPITPGVILTECMAQIGLVCFGMHLVETISEKEKIALSETKVEFLKPVFPEEKVTVFSEKIYFRFNKLKCNVKMYNQANELVCKGTISGIINPSKQ